MVNDSNSLLITMCCLSAVSHVKIYWDQTCKHKQAFKVKQALTHKMRISILKRLIYLHVTES
jgi:hypothetical protein